MTRHFNIWIENQMEFTRKRKTHKPMMINNEGLNQLSKRIFLCCHVQIKLCQAGSVFHT